nr:MAG TPA: hypothetical protein [Caudoviricetes sp.]
MDREEFIKRMTNGDRSESNSHSAYNAKMDCVARSASAKENLSILQEECAELIQAISKYNRGLDENGYGVLEELADILVTTYVVELSGLFTDEQIDRACDIKLNRAYDRLPDNLKMEEDQI